MISLCEMSHNFTRCPACSDGPPPHFANLGLLASRPLGSEQSSNLLYSLDLSVGLPFMRKGPGEQTVQRCSCQAASLHGSVSVLRILCAQQVAEARPTHQLILHSRAAGAKRCLLYHASFVPGHTMQGTVRACCL